ncbi:MAG TPA: nucleotidyltransferase domain-containing protein [Stellaceae bacterium]|nr:nucleotidyltransferase domain-containing protein [Stellaceae bacterium]
MQERLTDLNHEIARLCRRFHVRQLDVFGSAAREDFDPMRSDVDFVVHFEPDHPLGGLEAYFGLKEALEALLDRKVDLVSHAAIRNPYLKRSIEAGRETIYAA